MIPLFAEFGLHPYIIGVILIGGIAALAISFGLDWLKYRGERAEIERQSKRKGDKR